VRVGRTEVAEATPPFTVTTAAVDRDGRRPRRVDIPHDDLAPDGGATLTAQMPTNSQNLVVTEGDETGLDAGQKD